MQHGTVLRYVTESHGGGSINPVDLLAGFLHRSSSSESRHDLELLTSRKAKDDAKQHKGGV